MYKLLRLTHSPRPNLLIATYNVMDTGENARRWRLLCVHAWSSLVSVGCQCTPGFTFGCCVGSGLAGSAVGLQLHSTFP